MITEAIVKWILATLTGAGSALLIAFRKQLKEFIKFRKKTQEKELLKDVNKDVDTLEHRMEHHEDEIEIELRAREQYYYRKLSELEERMMNILVPMREALLSSHYQALLEKCKSHVQAGQLTADELDSLENDYETYKKLGGNGHMELWMTRVRQLKII